MNGNMIDEELDRLVRTVPHMGDNEFGNYIRPNQFVPRKRINALPRWARMIRFTGHAQQDFWPNRENTHVQEASELLNTMWSRLGAMERDADNEPDRIAVHEARLYVLRAMAQLDGIVAPMTKYIIRYDPSWLRKLQAIAIYLGGGNAKRADERLLDRQ